MSYSGQPGLLSWPGYRVQVGMCFGARALALVTAVIPGG